jgi:hypothetical protein
LIETKRDVCNFDFLPCLFFTELNPKDEELVYKGFKGSSRLGFFFAVSVGFGLLNVAKMVINVASV